LVSDAPTAAVAPEPRFPTPFGIPRLSAPPAVDGDPSGWNGAEFPVQETPARQVSPSPASRLKVAYDANYLYVGLRVPLRPTDTLRRGNAWGVDDGAEVCVQSLAGKKPGPIYVVHGFLNGQFESVTDAGATAAQAQALAAGTRYAAVVGREQWSATWALPWSALGVKPVAGAKLAFNVGLRRSATNEWLQWAGSLAQTWVVSQAGTLELR